MLHLNIYSLKYVPSTLKKKMHVEGKTKLSLHICLRASADKLNVNVNARMQTENPSKRV